MSLYLFVVSLILTLGTVGAALLYLRGITRRVLVAQCGSDTGAEFWLRAADVLALASIFVTVVLVASGVWRKVPAREAARASETAL
jgi:hypothetical protein